MKENSERMKGSLHRPRALIPRSEFSQADHINFNCWRQAICPRAAKSNQLFTFKRRYRGKASWVQNILFYPLQKKIAKCNLLEPSGYQRRRWTFWTGPLVKLCTNFLFSIYSSATLNTWSKPKKSGILWGEVVAPRKFHSSDTENWTPLLLFVKTGADSIKM